jgi:hypothetical protein
MIFDTVKTRLLSPKLPMRAFKLLSIKNSSTGTAVHRREERFNAHAFDVGVDKSKIMEILESGCNTMQLGIEMVGVGCS